MNSPVMELLVENKAINKVAYSKRSVLSRKKRSRIGNTNCWSVGMLKHRHNSQGAGSFDHTENVSFEPVLNEVRGLIMRLSGRRIFQMGEIVVQRS